MSNLKPNADDSAKIETKFAIKNNFTLEQILDQEEDSISSDSRSNQMESIK